MCTDHSRSTPQHHPSVIVQQPRCIHCWYWQSFYEILASNTCSHWHYASGRYWVHTSSFASSRRWVHAFLLAASSPSNALSFVSLTVVVLLMEDEMCELEALRASTECATCIYCSLILTKLQEIWDAHTNNYPSSWLTSPCCCGAVEFRDLDDRPALPLTSPHGAHPVDSAKQPESSCWIVS